ncbi:hypothetical protein P7K49_028542, partial [Saguinus oedipus]
LQRSGSRRDPQASFRISDGAEEPAGVCAVFWARTAAAQSQRVGNQTKRERKQARVCRLATQGSQNPRCTPFF